VVAHRKQRRFSAGTRPPQDIEAHICGSVKLAVGDEVPCARRNRSSQYEGRFEGIPDPHAWSSIDGRFVIDELQRSKLHARRHPERSGIADGCARRRHPENQRAG
jgi:hypothetical protein